MTGWKGEGVPPFDYAAELMDARIAYIVGNALSGVYAGSSSVPHSVRVYLSGPENFRNSIAKRKGYKANRKESVKPFHFYNLKAYLQNVYDVEVTDGIEADDALCIERAKDPENTIVCSRDKDLRQHEGWIYSWEIGKQPSFGPFYVKGYGEIEVEKKGKLNVLRGYGPKFFLSQVLVGDATDNYPGLPGYGPVETFKTLGATHTYAEGLEAVREAYRGFYGDSWKEELVEQMTLAYILTKDLGEYDEKFHGALPEQD